MNALSIGNSAIRQFDGLYSLNDLHKASGGDKNQQPAFFVRNEQTQALINEINNSVNSQSLAIKSKGGRNGGTFACKELVYAYAMWLSAEFYLAVIRSYDEQVQKQLEAFAAPQIQLATPAQKLQIRRLVEVKAKSIGGGRCDYSIVWRKAQDECKFNKLDELTPAAYQMACKFFNVEPLTGELEHEQPAALPAPIPEGMQLIPKMRDDEYYWKDKIHELNPINNHGSYKIRTIHHKPEATILVPFTIDSKDKTWVMYLRNGMLHRREQMFATHAHEIDGWRLA